MTTPTRRLVLRTAEGDYGINGLIHTATVPSQLFLGDKACIATLVRVTDRYVLYQEEPRVALATS